MITSSSLSLRFNLDRVGPGVLLAVRGDAVGRAAGPLLPTRTCPANSVCLSYGCFFPAKSNLTWRTEEAEWRDNNPALLNLIS